MTRESPVVLRLSPALAARPSLWRALLTAQPQLPVSEALRLAEPFRFKNDERRFVRELLARKGNLWIYRCDQRCFCGDFVVVDMSCPDPRRRSATVLDLKQNAPLRQGGGGAGVQFRNAAQAVAAVAAEGALVPGAAVTLLSGDRKAVLAWLGAPAVNWPDRAVA
jgi:hypothetical protein